VRPGETMARTLGLVAAFALAALVDYLGLMLLGGGR